MKDSFILYNSFYEPIKTLKNEQLGKLLRAIFNYTINGEITQEEDILIAFMFIKNQLDLDNEKYQKICERNRNNGSKGGRPRKENLKTIYGEEVPKEDNNKHFLYLIYDEYNDEYKIGETRNLIQRRYDIKRPTNDLIVIDYYLGETKECQDYEKDILNCYSNYSIGGDWFKLPYEKVIEILNRWFTKKPIRFLKNPTIPKKPDNDNDNDNEYDNDIYNSSSCINNNIYDFVEKNFGRILTPIEISKIDKWNLEFKEDIIKYAIQISVLGNKKTFNYVNGILNNWKSKGYKTLEEIKSEESKPITKENLGVYDYDWLNEEE